MSNYKLKTGKIEETVVEGYKKIENSVVNGYKKVEDAFVEKFLDKKENSEDEAK